MRIRRMVEFSDTDMAGIMHFANFFRFMEAAEHAYLRARGLSVSTEWQGEHVSFPRVAASCDYLKPARFEDVLEIEARLERLGRTSVAWGFEVTRGEDLIARGSITAVLCKVAEGRIEPVAIPEGLKERLRAEAPADRIGQEGIA